MDSTPTPFRIGPERRQQQRRTLRTNAELRFPGSTAPVPVRTLDISVSGIGVVAEINPPTGMKVMVRLAPPAQPRGKPAIDVQAVVMHSIFTIRESGFKIGLQFAELTPEAADAVTRYLNG